MRLAEFIRSHHEQVLAEWETFARTLEPASQGMSKTGLRDHAEEILTAIVSDMESLETAEETAEKSKGRKTGGRLAALGEIHAALRIETGFTLAQVVSEYRALRASVLRLWAEPGSDARGVLRFNEAIDEALSEATTRYTERTNQSRDLLIGLASHDLRNPLGGILMGAAVLTRASGMDERNARVAARIHSSAKRMVRIVDDLLDLTRVRLGAEIPITRRPVDLGSICETVIGELEGSHPGAVIRYTPSGDLRGDWDGDRLAQVLSNLLGNALKHGDPSKPVHVVVRGESEIVLDVHNEGSPIPRHALGEIFEPTVRNVQHAGTPPSGLGLGLFIAKALVTSHGGAIGVKSTETEGTTFTVRLPRAAEPKRRWDVNAAGRGRPQVAPSTPSVR